MMTIAGGICQHLGWQRTASCSAANAWSRPACSFKVQLGPVPDPMRHLLLVRSCATSRLGQAWLLHASCAWIPANPNVADGLNGCSSACCKSRCCSPLCSGSAARGMRTRAGSMATVAIRTARPAITTAIVRRQQKLRRRILPASCPPAPRHPAWCLRDDGSPTVPRRVRPVLCRSVVASRDMRPTSTVMVTGSPASLIRGARCFEWMIQRNEAYGTRAGLGCLCRFGNLGISLPAFVLQHQLLDGDAIAVGIQLRQYFDFRWPAAIDLVGDRQLSGFVVQL